MEETLEILQDNLGQALIDTAYMVVVSAIIGVVLGTLVALLLYLTENRLFTPNHAVPFFARIAESAFSEVDPGLLEAAISTGATTRQIIVDAVFPQALPSFIRGVVLTIISLIGYSAMVGTIGAGGIGDMAIQYGYNRYETGVLVVIVIILIVIVQIIQWIGDWFARKVTH